MKNNQFLRSTIVLTSLMLFVLVFFWQPSASAISSSFKTFLEPQPVSSTIEEWGKITRQNEPYFTQQAYLKASNVGEEDYFGTSVAISGDTLVVGSPGEDGDDTGTEDNSGAVYVFIQKDGEWTQEAYLKASNAEESDKFGGSVAISGDTLVVGATEEDSNGKDGEENNSAEAAGAVYVFVRSDGEWTQQAYLKASNAESGDRFGTAVAIEGDKVVVGTTGEDSNGIGGEEDNSALGAGAAYVFMRKDENWIQQVYLKASNAEEDDYFGGSVAISGNGVVVGAVGEDSIGINLKDNSAEDAGAAYFFWYGNEVWSQKAYLKASNAESEDFFGVSVAILGDTLVVGATGEDGNGSGEGNNDVTWSGAAYVFEHSAGKWMQQAYLKANNAGADDFFGESVAITRDTIVVGAFGESSSGTDPEDDSVYFSGAAYVFLRSGSDWVQQDYLKAAIADEEDSFGLPVAISDHTLVIGAYAEDGDGSDPVDNSMLEAGAAYVFSKDNLIYLPLILR